MRILFITAFYPPCDYGYGYMRLCERVADEMHTRGHAVMVLTSTYRHGEEAKPYPVHRRLELDPDWFQSRPAMFQFFADRPRREREAARSFSDLARAFAPDVIFIWHGQGLSRAMFQQAERLPGAVTVYYLANYLPEQPDEYLEYWDKPGGSRPAQWVKAPLGALARRILRAEQKPVIPAFAHTIHVSQHVRQRLQPMVGEDAVTIPTGTDFSALGGLQRQAREDGLRCILAGRVSPEKGLHTAIAAFAALNRTHELGNTSLTIMGDGPPDYLARLKQQVREAGLEQVVTFEAPLDLAGYRQRLAAHDVLLFPSNWDEPLSNTMLEAMALGLCVIGTIAGGSGEALIHEQTGLVFPAEDAEALARQIIKLRAQPELFEVLTREARRFVRQHYDLRQSLDQIEAHLLALAATARNPV